MIVNSSESRRRHVLVAGAQVFSAHGYSRTTMGELAQAAGLSRPALYLVFARKEQLFSTLLREGDPAVAKGAGQETAPAATWLLWACGLWMGESDPKHSKGGPGCRSPENPSDYRLIEALLQEGIESRHPGRAGLAAADVARLLATCMRGLSEIEAGEAERRRLLSLQVDLVAQAAGWRLAA